MSNYYHFINMLSSYVLYIFHIYVIYKTLSHFQVCLMFTDAEDENCLQIIVAFDTPAKSFFICLQCACSLFNPHKVILCCIFYKWTFWVLNLSTHTFVLTMLLLPACMYLSSVCKSFTFSPMLTSFPWFVLVPFQGQKYVAFF